MKFIIPLSLVVAFKIQVPIRMLLGLNENLKIACFVVTVIENVIYVKFKNLIVLLELEIIF